MKYKVLILTILMLLLVGCGLTDKNENNKKTDNNESQSSKISETIKSNVEIIEK